MCEPRVVVLDASVGVKWIKPEAGREQALDLLRRHRDGDAVIVVAAHFLHEVVAVAMRKGGADFGRRAWTALTAAELTTIGLDQTLADATFEQCERLGCAFHDGLAPAIASRLGATLVSSDARAHARFPGVQLL